MPTSTTMGIYCTRRAVGILAVITGSSGMILADAGATPGVTADEIAIIAAVCGAVFMAFKVGIRVGRWIERMEFRERRIKHKDDDGDLE
ncbi:MAG: hypothetical protein ACR2RE_10870 [Geminicoccaceae bacterium]